MACCFPSNWDSDLTGKPQMISRHPCPAHKFLFTCIIVCVLLGLRAFWLTCIFVFRGCICTIPPFSQSIKQTKLPHGS